MGPILPPARSPVQRDNASRYLLYMLLSFAASVSLTRLFLDLTGYPQLGGGGFHIAHVLWGGLLLFIAALLPLMFINRWFLVLNAIICGAGVGLFIDEVGKFITSTNDYFYPAAAPIIYAFFLLTVLLYLEFSKPKKRDSRAELYAVLDDLEEVLDQDLSENERDRILFRLNRLEENTQNPDFSRLIKELKDFIACDTLYLVPPKPGLNDRLNAQFKRFEDRWSNRRGLQIGLAGALLATGLWTLRFPIVLLLGINNPTLVQDIMGDIVHTGLIRSPIALTWFEATVALQTSVAIILIIGAGFLMNKKDKRGIAYSYLGLLLSLTMVDLLVFYFSQFSTIVTAAYQFFLLLVVLYYRHRYLRSSYRH